MNKMKPSALIRVGMASMLTLGFASSLFYYNEINKKNEIVMTEELYNSSVYKEEVVELNLSNEEEPTTEAVPERIEVYDNLTIEELTDKLKRNPTIEELATKLNISVAEVDRLIQYDEDTARRAYGRMVQRQYGMAAQDFRTGEYRFSSSAYGRNHTSHTRYHRTDSNRRAQESKTEANGG